MCVKSDCWPKLTDDYDTGITALPIAIECMEINTPDATYLIPTPIIIANALIELKLNSVIEDYEWGIFKYLGDLYETERTSDPSNPLLLFSSLKSLVFSVSNLDYFMHFMEDDYPIYSDDEDGYEIKRDDIVYQSNFTNQFN
ncbi:hypothetical protein FBU31_000359 [Coemansia sp. 'formosensis']|nr:hypothetical protein FBU31_000359 [Coemansia sp. 'formosensis']